MKTSFTSGFKRSLSTFCISCLCISPSLYPVIFFFLSLFLWFTQRTSSCSIGCSAQEELFTLKCSSCVRDTQLSTVVLSLPLNYQWVLTATKSRLHCPLRRSFSLCCWSLSRLLYERVTLSLLSKHFDSSVVFSVLFSLTSDEMCLYECFVCIFSPSFLCLVFLSQYVWCLFTFLIFAPYFSLLSSSFRRKRESLIDVLKIEREWIIHSIVFLSSCHWHLYQNVFRFLTHGSLILEKREETHGKQRQRQSFLVFRDSIKVRFKLTMISFSILWFRSVSFFHSLWSFSRQDVKEVKTVCWVCFLSFPLFFLPLYLLYALFSHPCCYTCNLFPLDRFIGLRHLQTHILLRETRTCSCSVLF